MSFTFKGYETILDAFKHFGYFTTSFRKFDPLCNYQLLIRHDVDYFPENCLKLMEIEEKYGYKSTFFFLLSSPFYNPLSNKIQELFKEIHKRGFNIGLHYDFEAKIFNSSINHQGLIREILDGEFDIYSDHKPRKFGMKQYDGMHIKSTYEKHYAWDSKYLTDSNREWKYGHPIDYLEECEANRLLGRNIQLLIHPIWYHENEMNKNLSLLQLQVKAANMVLEIFKQDEKDYEEKK